MSSYGAACPDLPSMIGRREVCSAEQNSVNRYAAMTSVFSPVLRSLIRVPRKRSILDASRKGYD